MTLRRLQPFIMCTAGLLSSPVVAQDQACAQRDGASDWQLCTYDLNYAYVRVHQDFCGQSPSYADLAAYKAKSTDDKRKVIQADTKACMGTNTWRGKNGVLWEMADGKIHPTTATKAGEDAGEIPLSDYYDDYALFIYHQLDGADARGVFTANYYVKRTEGNPTTYTMIDDVPLTTNKPGVLSVTADLYPGIQQFVPKAQRAGVLTTAWTANGLTMFASIPRTTAAHYYRQYLGMDIAKAQGLYDPGADFKLVDYDSKGTLRPQCAGCHRTLDPMTYPFTQYNGLSFNIAGININNAGGFVGAAIQGSLQVPAPIQAVLSVGRAIPGILLIAEYNPNRIQVLSGLNAATEPNLAGTPSAGMILGQKVNNLVEWAKVAANSDQFAKTMVSDYWKLLIGTPTTDPASIKDINELTALFKGKYQYSVEAMVLDLITRDAYGAP